MGDWLQKGGSIDRGFFNDLLVGEFEKFIIIDNETTDNIANNKHSFLLNSFFIK
ncbi:hypothetical protein ACEU2D_21260 [Brevibacillus laterosporus]|uniref:hypothetical protein n=1 Tax=Brevibacillus laterosporus TaxID=1465 RepID=UPI0035A6BBCF